MIKFNPLALYSILLVLVCSCTEKTTQEHADTVVFDLAFDNTSLDTPLHLSEIFDSVKYIQIESNPIIGSIDGIRYHNNRYYVRDVSSQALYVINEDGQIVASIKNRGRASNEYITLQGFDVNPTNGEISIYDSSYSRIQVYSSEGKFIRSIYVEGIIRDFAVMENGEYLCYTPDYNKGVNRGLWRVDSSGKFKEQLISIDDDFLYGGLYPKYLSRIDDKTVGLLGGEDHDRIYHITIDTMVVKYKFKFNLSIPDDLKSRPILNFNNHKEDVYTKNSYIETDNWMTIRATDMVNQIIFIHNKNTQKSYPIKSQNDLIEDIETYGSYQAGGYNRFIGVLSSDMILSYPSLQKHFKDVTTESNPIIVVSYTN